MNKDDQHCKQSHEGTFQIPYRGELEDVKENIDYLLSAMQGVTIESKDDHKIDFRFTTDFWGWHVKYTLYFNPLLKLILIKQITQDGFITKRITQNFIASFKQKYLNTMSHQQG